MLIRSSISRSRSPCLIEHFFFHLVSHCCRQHQAARVLGNIDVMLRELVKIGAACMKKIYLKFDYVNYIFSSFGSIRQEKQQQTNKLELRLESTKMGAAVHHVRSKCSPHFSIGIFSNSIFFFHLYVLFTHKMMHSAHRIMCSASVVLASSEFESQRTMVVHSAVFISQCSLNAYSRDVCCI